MRHTLTAQVLARAIQEEFPGSKLAIGPTIENGFYYDVESSTPISIDDLPKIEARMHKILGEHSSINRIATPRDEAIKTFAETGAKPEPTPGKNFFDTGVALVTDKPAEGVPSIDTKEGMDKCWG